MPNDQSLAELTKVVVLQQGADVIIYAEGRAPGAGGSLVFRRSPDRMLPPGFFVTAEPGNPGINPDAPFSMHVNGAAAFYGVGSFDEYRVIHRGGTELVTGVQVEESARP